VLYSVNCDEFENEVKRQRSKSLRPKARKCRHGWWLIRIWRS